MIANTITFQKTATKKISLCVETSFGFEVLVIDAKQAQQLADGLRDTLSTMPSRFSEERTGFLGLTQSALRAGFNGA